MNTDLQVQHELLKTALEATDNYLFVEKRAQEAGFATNQMIHDFSYEMSRAHDALQTLGVLADHQEYMSNHVDVMLKLHGHKDSTIGDLPYAHIPQSDTGEVEESKIPSFKTFIGEAKKSEPKEDEDTISDEEIDKMVNDLTWEDIEDMYDDDEFEDEDEEEEEEDDEEQKEKELEEKISVQGRLKKRQAFARQKSKRNVIRGMKLRRASSMEVLKKRAVLAARRSLYKRFLRGRNKATLSAAEKDRIEQQVGRMRFMQSAIALKMLPKMRSIEQKRLARYRTKGK